jgi:hypothetical protein
VIAWVVIGYSLARTTGFQRSVRESLSAGNAPVEGHDGCGVKKALVDLMVA